MGCSSNSMLLDWGWLTLFLLPSFPLFSRFIKQFLLRKARTWKSTDHGTCSSHTQRSWQCNISASSRSSFCPSTLSKTTMSEKERTLMLRQQLKENKLFSDCDSGWLRYNVQYTWYTHDKHKLLNRAQRIMYFIPAVFKKYYHCLYSNTTDTRSTCLLHSLGHSRFLVPWGLTVASSVIQRFGISSSHFAIC